MDNLFASLLENLQQEVLETLFIHDGVEVERSSLAVATMRCYPKVVVTELPGPRLMSRHCG